MYWPLNAPRIYSANKRRRKPRDDDSVSSQQRDAEGEEKENAAILGLKVSRNGHLLTTITETTLTIWQASVRQSDGVFCYF